MDYKIMKIICMFDLPVETDDQRRAYRVFRKNLIKEGFIMVQFSVYARTCQNRDHASRIERRIQKFLPKEGNVRLLSVTEKQYSDMKLLVGSRNATEQAFKTERMLIL